MKLSSSSNLGLEIKWSNSTSLQGTKSSYRLIHYVTHELLTIETTYACLYRFLRPFPTQLTLTDSHEAFFVFEKLVAFGL